MKFLRTRNGKITAGAGGVALVALLITVLITLTGSSGTTTTRTTTAPHKTTTTSTTSGTTTTIGLNLPMGGTVPASFSPLSFTQVSDNVSYVLGSSTCGSSYCAALARSINGGSTWVAINLPNVPIVSAGSSAVSGISGVRFSTPETGWVFGPSLYYTSNAGTSWTSITLPGASATTAVSDAEVAGSYIYVLAGPVNVGGQSDEALFMGPTDTSALTAVPTAIAPYTAGLTTDLQGFPYGVALSIGSNENTSMFVTNTPGSAGLSQVPSPCPSQSFPYPSLTPAAATSTTSNVDMWVTCGENPAAGSEEKAIYTSSNLGQVFTLQVAPSPSESVLGGLLNLASEGSSGVGSATLSLAASSGATFIYTSPDGGKSWHTYTHNDGGQGVSYLGWASATNGYAILGTGPTSSSSGDTTTPALIYTTNAGSTWGLFKF